MSKNIEVLLRARETMELFGLESIPQNGSETRRPPLHTEPVGGSQEAELVQRVFLVPEHEAPRVVVFCGVEQTDGADGICARAAKNLASQTGLPVCIVEGDFYSPSLHQYFGVSNVRGLTDALLEPGSIRDFVHSLPESNLWVLPGGSRCREVRTLWKSDWLRSRIAELGREFSYVLIYCPQVNQRVEAMLLGQIADGVILVLESMVTRRETARTVKENLCAANVKILGAVLNNHTFSIPETLYRKL
jgi:Mrp family chromosome partitioning ATPase